MAGIREIRKVFDQYPEINYESTDLSISIPKPNEGGYEVNLSVHADGITLYLDGWHQDYESIEKVWPHLVYSLTPYRRLLVWARGSSRYKWELELLIDGKWKKDWVIGLLFYPFWRRQNQVYLKNNLIEEIEKIDIIIKSL